MLLKTVTKAVLLVEAMLLLVLEFIFVEGGGVVEEEIKG